MKKDEIKEKLVELGVDFDPTAKKEDLEALLEIEEVRTKAPEGEKVEGEPKKPKEEPKEEPKEDNSLKVKLEKVGLPNGEYHLVNDGNSSFIICPIGQIVSPKIEDGEEKKKLIKMVHRFNRASNEVRALVHKRQENAGKAGGEYHTQIEFSL